MDAAEKELNGFLHCHCVVVTQSRQLEQRITTSNQEILSEIDSIAIRVQVRGKEEEEENQADANEMKWQGLARSHHIMANKRKKA